MKLIAALNKEEWEKLDEDARSNYVEDKKDEGFYLLKVKEAHGRNIANVKKLTGALSEERDKAAEAVKKLAEFGDMSAKEAKDAILKFKNWKPDEETEKAIAERVKEIVKDKDAKILELQATNKNLAANSLDGQKDLATREAIAAFPGASRKLLELPLRKVVDIVEIDGKQTTVILNEKGKPAYNDQAGLMTPEEYVRTVMKKDPDYAPAFPSEEKGGSGAGGGTKPGIKKASGDPDAPLPSPGQRLKDLREKQEA